MTIDSATLSLFSFASNGSQPSLLSILYGGGTGASATDPLVALRAAEAGETKQVAAVEKQPETARDIAAFKAALSGAKTPADLLSNPAALKVLLTANGLGDQAQYTALAKKALLSDTSKTGSIASQLPNTQWLATAKLYDFANKGLSVVGQSSVVQSIVDGYAEVQWRSGLDASTPGLSNALAFRSQAATVTSVDQILGDTTLRTVVTTALGIPEQIAFQPLEAQEKAISARLNIGKLQDKSFVEQFAQRYLLAVRSASDTSSASVASSLLA